MTDIDTNKLKKESELPLPLMVLIGAILVVGSVWFGVSNAPTYRMVPAGQVVEEIPIYSMNFGSETHGSFVLGCGDINLRSVYYYYLKQNDGGYILRNQLTDYSVIYMDATEETAHITVVSRTSVSCEESITDSECVKKYSWINTYQFHVPKNTIKQTFNGDVR
jgi:hypothetical protein